MQKKIDVRLDEKFGLGWTGIFIALLENGQTTDGIQMSEVLHPYTGFAAIR